MYSSAMRPSIAFAFLAFAASAWAAMPATEQNALVKEYCAVCHTDAARNGGLSLEHYDAARRDPVLAAMILSKLKNGAMGAAGSGVPDKAAQRAWLDSTTEQAAGAKEWFVTREGDTVSAGIVREVPPRQAAATDAPVYRLQMVCNAATGVGEMQLTWSPQPQTGSTLTVSSDGRAPVGFPLTGHESMGNGGTVQSGHASAVLSTGKSGPVTLAKNSLVIRDVFPSETVEFSFTNLDAGTHSALSKCF
jgi:hypothetical protein